jgi:prophage regulatory protein
MPGVEGKVGSKKSTIYKLISEGRFPRPFHPTPRVSCWFEHEIDNWLEQRAAESRQEKQATA